MKEEKTALEQKVELEQKRKEELKNYSSEIADYCNERGIKLSSRTLIDEYGNVSSEIVIIDLI